MDVVRKAGLMRAHKEVIICLKDGAGRAGRAVLRVPTMDLVSSWKKSMREFEGKLKD